MEEEIHGRSTVVGWRYDFASLRDREAIERQRRLFSLPENERDLIDAVCREFKKRIQRGSNVSIEHLLDDVPTTLCRPVLQEVLCVASAHLSSEDLSRFRENLARQFPSHADVLDKSVQEVSSSASPPAGFDQKGKGRGDDADRELPVIEGYEVLERLATGGMGVVYKARDVRLGRAVAIKMIAGNRDVERSLARLYDEAGAIGRLQHPNIVQIFEVGEYRGQTFLALEYVDGGNLQHHLAQRRPSHREAAELLARLARVMHYVHSRGIVHRDLKPANILLTADGSLKVTDFGVAKIHGASRDRTITGEFVGTPEYMAPEQCQSQRALGPATDVYALGVILHVLLTGSAPFEGDSVADLLNKVLHEEPTPPSRRDATIPRDLDVICLKCLQKEADRRYGSAEGLAEDLERFLERRPIRARRSSTGERVILWGRRNPLAATLAIGLCLMVLSTTLFTSIVALLFRQLARDEAEARQSADRSRKTALVHQANAELSRDQATDALCLATRQRARLTAQRALDLCASGEVATGMVWLVEALRLAEESQDGALESALRANLALWADEMPQRVADIDVGRPICAAALRPDGKMLATGTRNGSVQLWDLGTGKSMGKPMGHHVFNAPSTIWSVRFSPDGRRLATTAADDRLILWDVATQSMVGMPRRQVYPTSTLRLADVWTSVFSPDGIKIATGASDGKVRIFHVESGQLLHLLEGHSEGVLCAQFTPDGGRLLTGSRDGTALLWDTNTGQIKQPIFEQCDYWVQSLAIRGDGSVAAIGAGQKIYLRELETRHREREPIVLEEFVKALRFHDSSDCLVVGTDQGATRLYSLASHRPKGQTVWLEAAISDIDVAGMDFVAAGQDGHAVITRPPISRQTRLPVGRKVQAGKALALRILGDGDGLVCSYSKEPVRCWSLSSGSPILLPTFAADLALDVSADGRRWLVCRRESPSPLNLQIYGIHFLDSDDMETPVARGVHPGNILAAALMPDGKHAVTAGADGHARVWNVATGTVLFKTPRHGGIVSGVACAPDSRGWLSISGKNVRCWRLGDAKPVADLLHPREVSKAVFSPCGERVLAGSKDGSAFLWDLPKAALLGEPMRHHSGISALAFAKDGSRMAIASMDGVVRLWDVEARMSVGPAFFHQSPAHTVEFHPRKQELVVGTSEGEIHVWNTAISPTVDSLESIARWVGQLTMKRLDASGIVTELSPNDVALAPTAEYGLEHPRTTSIEAPP